MSDAEDRLARLRRAIVTIAGDPTWEETVVKLDRRVEEAERHLRAALPLLVATRYTGKRCRDGKELALRIESFLRRLGK